MTDYPTNITYMDAASFESSIEDPSIKPADTEGGYVISRPRFTRAPRRTFQWKYVDMTDTSRTALENFWKTVFGSSNAFNWTHPISSEVINVRFMTGMKLNFKRIGFGPINIWETDLVTIVEV